MPALAHRARRVPGPQRQPVRGRAGHLTASFSSWVRHVTASHPQPSQPLLTPRWPRCLTLGAATLSISTGTAGGVVSRSQCPQDVLHDQHQVLAPAVRSGAMRYGFKTAQMNTTWSAMLDVWRVADQLEIFESGWNFDHFEPIFSDRSGPCLEGWSMLAALANATSRLRLGCQVTGMPYRHPSVLANIAATVDGISNGRLIIGLGAGWNQEESDALGIRLPPLKERFDQFEEGVQVIVRLLSDGRANFTGEHFTLTDAWCEPKAVQRPHPPIAIGGNGE